MAPWESTVVVDSAAGLAPDLQAAGRGHHRHRLIHARHLRPALLIGEVEIAFHES